MENLSPALVSQAKVDYRTFPKKKIKYLEKYYLKM